MTFYSFYRVQYRLIIIAVVMSRDVQKLLRDAVRVEVLPRLNRVGKRNKKAGTDTGRLVGAFF